MSRLRWAIAVSQLPCARSSSDNSSRVSQSAGFRSTAAVRRYSADRESPRSRAWRACSESFSAVSERPVVVGRGEEHPPRAPQIPRRHAQRRIPDRSDSSQAVTDSNRPMKVSTFCPAQHHAATTDSPPGGARSYRIAAIRQRSGSQRLAAELVGVPKDCHWAEFSRIPATPRASRERHKASAVPIYSAAQNR